MFHHHSHPDELCRCQWRADRDRLLAEMRDWLLDIEWQDIDIEDAMDGLTEAEILAAIERHYAGGVLAFCRMAA